MFLRHRSVSRASSVVAVHLLNHVVSAYERTKQHDDELSLLTRRKVTTPRMQEPGHTRTRKSVDNTTVCTVWEEEYRPAARSARCPLPAVLYNCGTAPPAMCSTRWTKRQPRSTSFRILLPPTVPCRGWTMLYWSIGLMSHCAFATNTTTNECYMPNQTPISTRSGGSKSNKGTNASPDLRNLVGGENKK